MKAIFSITTEKEKIDDIKNRLNEDHESYYGKHGFKEIFVQTGLEHCGYKETDKGFRWLRSSGTYIEYCGDGFWFVSGRRHSINEFLNQFFSKEELEKNAIVHQINSQEPSRRLGDTLPTYMSETKKER